MRWLLLLLVCVVAVMVAWPEAEPVPAARVEDGAVGHARASAPQAARSNVDRSDLTGEPAPEPAPQVAADAEPPLAAEPVTRAAATGPLLRGRVYSLDATPIEGARVVVLPVLAGRRAAPAVVPRGCAVVHTDAAGVFAVRCRNERPCDVAVSAPGHAPAVVASVTPVTGGADLIVTLLGAARVTGRVTGPRGARTAHVAVELWVEGAGAAQLEPDLGPGSLCPGGQLVASTETDAAGRFAFDDLPAGAAVVGIAARLGSARTAVQLVAGHEQRVELALSAPGRVRGTAKPGCLVLLYGGQLTRSISPRGDGSFELPDIPPGKYLIAAVSEPISTHIHAVVQEYEVSGRSTLAHELVVEGGEIVDVELPAPSDVTGGLTGAAWVNGAPAVGATVKLEPADGTGAYVRRAKVGPGGGFGIPAVPGGDYDVTLWPAGVESAVARQNCRIVNGAAIHITLIAQ